MLKYAENLPVWFCASASLASRVLTALPSCGKLSRRAAGTAGVLDCAGAGGVALAALRCAVCQDAHKACEVRVVWWHDRHASAQTQARPNSKHVRTLSLCACSEGFIGQSNRRSVVVVLQAFLRPCLCLPSCKRAHTSSSPTDMHCSVLRPCPYPSHLHRPLRRASLPLPVLQ